VIRVAAERYGVVSVMAHAWEANEEGMAWYSKRGFTMVTKVDDYYKRLAPQTAAFIVRRDLGPCDMLAWNKKDLPEVKELDDLENL